MLGELGEPGVYHRSFQFSDIMAREALFASGPARFVSAKQGRDSNAEQMWREAMSPVEKNWPRGPHRYSAQGELRVGGEPIAVNPAFRFGVRQADKLRSVEDLKRSSTNEATCFKTPTNLPA